MIIWMRNLISQSCSNQIGEQAHKNRRILSQAMQKFGFEPLKEEFWYFSHGGIAGRETLEPLDIKITPKMHGI